MDLLASGYQLGYPFADKFSTSIGCNFCMSQVTPQVVRVSKCDRHVTGHTPGRIIRNGTVLSPATGKAGFTRYWCGVSPLNHFRLRKLKWAPTVLRQVKEDLRGTQSPQTAIPHNRTLHNLALAWCCHKQLRCLAKRQRHTLFPQNGPWDLDIALAVSNEMVTYLG